MLTAAQINDPQTGKVEIREAKMPSPNPPPTPKGWWSVRNVSGSIDAVLSHIADQADIPPHAKAFLRADIAEKKSAGFNFVYLDAHYHIEKGTVNFHYSAVPDKKLL